VTFSSQWRLSAGSRAVALLVLLSPLVGCGRNEAQTYRVPKETKKTTLPNGWEESPRGEMRVASFRVRGEGGKNADISVIPLPGIAGTDMANVNRWREQVGLAPAPEPELSKSAQLVDVGGEKGQIYDLAGKNPGSGDLTRIVAAIVRKDGSAWFFKMTGDDSLVAKQKPAFLEYLKTFNWQSGSDPVASSESQLPPSHPPIGNLPAASPGVPSVSALPPSHPPIGNVTASGQGSPAAGPPSADSQKPEWQVPSAWKEIDGGPFLISKFMTTSVGGDAAVNVSMSAGEGGGLAANVNRWRGQLGLSDLSNDQLADQATSVDIPGGKATFVDMAGTDAKSGQKARVIAAVVPRGQRTWFYKLMGAPAVVEANKEIFTNFVKAVKYN
jgi:hypothetical protein